VWLKFATKTRGDLVVDAGAHRALVSKGKSLLASGLTEVAGEFEMGDPVRVMGPDGDRVGIGLASYSASEIRRIMGHHSSEIANILGYFNGPEVINRDDFVLAEELNQT